MSAPAASTLSRFDTHPLDDLLRRDRIPHIWCPTCGLGVVLNSFIGVPMLLGGKLVGTLELVHTERNHFSQDHLQLLRLIAVQAAVAIENARLVQQREARLKRQIEELRIEIDEVKKARQVAEITETEYFQRLRKAAKSIRERTKLTQHKAG